MDWKITRLEYLADLIMVPIYAAIALALAFAGATPVIEWALYFAAGFMLWTLTEYAMHRWLFHGIYKREHAMHHMRPREWIGVSAWMMFPIFAAVWLAMVSIGNGIGCGGVMFAGYATAYYAYVAVHLMIHHTDWAIVHSLREAHEGHHRGAGGNYGVSTTLWDRVFFTRI